MIEFWMTGIVSALGIGSAIALFIFWIGGKRLTRVSGYALVSFFCLVYHAVAGLGMCVPFLHFLAPTIIIPFGFGFGDGNRIFVIALLVQAVCAAALGMGIYWWMNGGRHRET